MIDAEVKWIDWADEFNGSTEEPDFLSITAGVGQRNAEGADNFQVGVCNVAWLNAALKKSPGLWPRGMLVVQKIDPDHVERTLQNLVQQFKNSQSWSAFAERLNRYLEWEFEDYNDFQGQPSVPCF